MTEFKAMMPKVAGATWPSGVPAVCIPAAVRAMRETRVGIGAENCNANASGAYTGEIATNMLVDAGCKYVIIGHSERRAMGETDAEVNAKVQAALAAELIPIVCVGETLEQREIGITEEWITMQIKAALHGVAEEKIRKIVIAYEPILGHRHRPRLPPPSRPRKSASTSAPVIRKALRRQDCPRHLHPLRRFHEREERLRAAGAARHRRRPSSAAPSLVPEKFVKIIEAANQPRCNLPQSPNGRAAQAVRPFCRLRVRRKSVGVDLRSTRAASGAGGSMRNKIGRILTHFFVYSRKLEQIRENAPQNQQEWVREDLAN